MTHLFFKAQGFTSDHNLPRLDSVKPLIDSYEIGAYGHWIFDANASSINDNISNRTLETMAGATVSPTFTKGGLVISLGSGNALLTDLADTATQNVTFCGVVKVYPSGVAMLFGDLPPSGAGANNGLAVFASSATSNSLLTVRPTGGVGADGINSLSAGMPLTFSEYFFVAASIDKLAKQAFVYVQQAKQESSASSTFTGTYVNSGHNFALGNSRYTSVTGGSFTIAEAIIFDEALDLNAVKGIATRSKKRLQSRDIVF